MDAMDYERDCNPPFFGLLIRRENHFQIYIIVVKPVGMLETRKVFNISTGHHFLIGDWRPIPQRFMWPPLVVIRHPVLR